MAQIRNRFDIQNSINEDNAILLGKLPNFFKMDDEISFVKGICISIVVHILFVFIMLILSALMGLVFPHLPKPDLPTRDIEFKLVQNESKPPININTKIRSDRDSQAGGKHDPKRAISEPSPKASKPSKLAQKQQPKQVKQPQVVQKQQQKPVPKVPMEPKVQPVKPAGAYHQQE